MGSAPKGVPVQEGEYLFGLPALFYGTWSPDNDQPNGGGRGTEDAFRNLKKPSASWSWSRQRSSRRTLNTLRLPGGTAINNFANDELIMTHAGADRLGRLGQGVRESKNARAAETSVSGAAGAGGNIEISGHAAGDDQFHEELITKWIQSDKPYIILGYKGSAEALRSRRVVPDYAGHRPAGAAPP
ncbi:acetyl-coa carboxylase [Culex quinquefasciatus]|uniref:Acetyl-coa carboxylase n=1 Tax=Culex quinquefasciatus TaxID=7176 RepID=B0WGR6_CULQU|nr:acetyl-coa carboxylase [Culex quinquefasciatus]|eukprot:XP_001847900.1 acetyl-coa carboxylase [Culex quinquefasciatus]